MSCSLWGHKLKKLLAKWVTGEENRRRRLGEWEKIGSKIRNTVKWQNTVEKAGGFMQSWLQLCHYIPLRGPGSSSQLCWMASGKSLPSHVPIALAVKQSFTEHIGISYRERLFKCLLLQLYYYSKAGESSFFPFAPVIELIQEWHIDGLWKGSRSDV